MRIENFLDAERDEVLACKDGEGTILISDLMKGGLYGALDFVRFLVLPSGTSVGSHAHGDDVEVYAVIAGEGTYEQDGERREVAAGDIMVNPPQSTHALYNTSVFDLKVLAFQSKCAKGGEKA